MGTQFLYMLEAICLTALLIIALIAVDPMRVETEKVYYSEPTSTTITDPEEDASWDTSIQKRL